MLVTLMTKSVKFRSPFHPHRDWQFATVLIAFKPNELWDFGLHELSQYFTV